MESVHGREQMFHGGPRECKGLEVDDCFLASLESLEAMRFIERHEGRPRLGKAIYPAVEFAVFAETVQELVELRCKANRVAHHDRRVSADSVCQHGVRPG